MRTQQPKAWVVVLAAAGLFAFTLLILWSTTLLADGTDQVLDQKPAPGAANTSLTGPLTVTLANDLAWFVPSGWQAAIPADAPGVASERATGAILLSAWQGAPRFEEAEVRLTITRAPRYTLGLAQYMAGAARGLVAEGYSVTQTAITTSLRADGLPAAVLVFGTRQVQGYQVAAFDHTGEYLLMMTMAAPADQYMAARADVLAMIGRATDE